MFCYKSTAQIIGGHSIGQFGFNINFNENKNVFAGISFDYGYFSFENVQTGIGIEINPLSYSYVMNKHSLSIINAMLYWNVLTLFDDRYVYVGPIFGLFISINYVNFINIKDFVYSYGLRFFSEKDTWAWWSTEVGCKNLNFEPTIYFTINVNIIGLLMHSIFN
jgi:hypothetical protein